MPTCGPFTSRRLDTRRSPRLAAQNVALCNGRVRRARALAQFCHAMPRGAMRSAVACSSGAMALEFVLPSCRSLECCRCRVLILSGEERASEYAYSRTCVQCRAEGAGMLYVV